MDTIIHKELSDRLVGLAFTAHYELGPGLLESAYEEYDTASRYRRTIFASQKSSRAPLDVNHSGIPFERQKVFPLRYKGDYISAYIADVVVDDKVLLELKAVKEFNDSMTAQILNYLRLSGLPVGYLLNFRNARLEWKRFIHGPG